MAPNIYKFYNFSIITYSQKKTGILALSARIKMASLGLFQHARQKAAAKFHVLMAWAGCRSEIRIIPKRKTRNWGVIHPFHSLFFLLRGLSVSSSPVYHLINARVTLNILYWVQLLQLSQSLGIPKWSFLKHWNIVEGVVWTSRK